DLRIDDPLADRVRHVEREDREGDEVEEPGPQHRLAGGEDARRDDGGDRVRRVVKSVDVVEGQRDHDDRDDDQHGLIQLFSRSTPSMMLATSSHRSVADSSVSYISFHLMMAMWSFSSRKS